MHTIKPYLKKKEEDFTITVLYRNTDTRISKDLKGHVLLFYLQ